jgi:hypothetical protein
MAKAALGSLFLASGVAAEKRGPNVAQVAVRYIHAQEAVMERDAGPREVAVLMSFYAPEYTYYHPQFGAKVTGFDTVRNGITAHLGETEQARITIKGSVVNGEVVSLALHESFVVVATGERVGRDRTTVLTIKHGKVVQRVDI